MGCDRVGDDVVDKAGGLNSIVKPSSSDLANDGLFITRRKLRRSTPFAVFLVPIHFLLDSPNGRLPYTSSRLDLMQGIALIEKGDDRRVLSKGCGMHDDGRKEKSWLM